MPTLTKRDQILRAIEVWIKQRPGLEFGNYGDVTAYRSEMRSITRDRHIAERFLVAVLWRSSIGEAELRQAFQSAYSGRLSIVDRRDGSIALDYCTGQYWPTEYRRAACAVLASALWAASREDQAMPDGNAIRKHFRSEFGANIQRRWFD